MPLRFLNYVAQTYNQEIENEVLFKRKPVPILTPEFFVIYTGSEKLRGYSLLLNYVNEYRQKGQLLNAAIDMAVKRCIDENILRDFLTQYGKEVRGMLYDDITIEKFAQIRGEES